jgi:hypothetical protein
VVDFCVVWGENIRREAYQPLSYWNDQWTCWVKADTDATWKAFDPAALSNNHLVTDVLLASLIAWAFLPPKFND